MTQHAHRQVVAERHERVELLQELRLREQQTHGVAVVVQVGTVVLRTRLHVHELERRLAELVLQLLVDRERVQERARGEGAVEDERDEALLPDESHHGFDVEHRHRNAIPHGLGEDDDTSC